MVHPLIVTAAATAGVGAAVAFELAVFRPWRDENWPHGFGEGVRSEFLKLRREVELAVNEISNGLQTLRDDHRRRNDGSQRRLSDGELDDFRKGVGEEASSESAQHEFEMHERQASFYRDRLQESMTQNLANMTRQQEGGLRRRNPSTIDPFTDVTDGTASSWHAAFSDRTTKCANERPNVETNGDLTQSLQDVTDEGHVILDTNGLSQTLSDQQSSFHDLGIDSHSSNASHSSDSPYRSNRALQAFGQEDLSSGSGSGRTESEPDFEVLSDTADSQGRWSHVDAPPSPTISSGSEPVAVRVNDAISVNSDGQESWAELSEPGSDEESSAPGEGRVRSL